MNVLDDLFPIRFMVKLKLILPSQLGIEMFFRYKFRQIRVEPDLNSPNQQKAGPGISRVFAVYNSRLK